MNKIQYLTDRIKEEIPIEILELAFLKPQQFNIIPQSLDSIIKHDIIVKVVLRDCNLFGGIQTFIDISGSDYQQIENGTIIKIGYGPTGGRVIGSALNIGYGFTGSLSGPPTIASAIAPSAPMTDSRIELIGDNVIFVEGYMSLRYTTLKCILFRDDDFKDISLKTMPVLADMVIAATKRHIYNSARIGKIGNGIVRQGVDMGMIQSIIDEYADATTIYRELLDTKWSIRSVLGDPESKRKLIRLLLPT
jgi:hypothetical protein